jgi:hypothetical protein
VPQRDRLLSTVNTVAGVALAAAGVLVSAVFLRFVYDGVSGRRQFNTGRDITLYYLVPGGIACLLFAALKLKVMARLRLLMSGIAVIMSLYAVELFLVLANEDPTTPVMLALSNSRDKEGAAADLTRRFGNPIDIRRAAEVLVDLQKKGVDAVPIVTASNHLFVRQADGSINSAIKIDGREVIPLGTVSGKVTLLCNENGAWVDYRSDSRGFNNPEEVWQAAPLDIAAVGDSFTHGYCVPGDKSFMGLIRQRTPATLNLGIAGEGPLLMLATLTEYLPRLTPKIVLWFYYEGNDLTDLQNERRNAVLRNYLADGFAQADLARQDDVDRAVMAEMPRLASVEQRNFNQRRSNAIFYGLIAFAKLTSLRQRIAPISETDPQLREIAADFEGPNFETFRETLQLAKTRVEAWGGQLRFVYLPDWARYTTYSSVGQAKRDDVLQLVRGLGIPIIDIDPVFRAHGDPLSLFPFRGNGHYTETGHRLVAEEVLRNIGEASTGGGAAPSASVRRQ